MDEGRGKWERKIVKTQVNIGDLCPCTCIFNFPVTDVIFPVNLRWPFFRVNVTTKFSILMMFIKKNLLNIRWYLNRYYLIILILMLLSGLIKFNTFQKCNFLHFLETFISSTRHRTCYWALGKRKVTLGHLTLMKLNLKFIITVHPHFYSFHLS